VRVGISRDLAQASTHSFPQRRLALSAERTWCSAGSTCQERDAQRRADEATQAPDQRTAARRLRRVRSGVVAIFGWPCRRTQFTTKDTSFARFEWNAVSSVFVFQPDRLECLNVLIYGE
jgi:hypothetical protein